MSRKNSIQIHSKPTRVFSVSGDIQAGVVNDVFSILTHALQGFVNNHKNGCEMEVKQKWVDQYANFNRLERGDHRRPTVQLENLKFNVLLNLLRPVNKKNEHDALIKYWNQCFKGPKSKKNQATKHLTELRTLRNTLCGHQDWEKATANFTTDRDVVKLFGVARKVLELVGHSPNEIRDSIAFFYASFVQERAISRDELMERQKKTDFQSDELRNQMADVMYAELNNRINGSKENPIPSDKILREWCISVLGMTISGSEISFPSTISFAADNFASSSINNTSERILAGATHPGSKNAQAKGSVKNCFYGVPSSNRAFVTRSKILADMEATLCENSSIKESRILALRGLGGMGKTQLMLRYCYLHRASYDFVFWLEVDSWSSAIESFYKLAINLGLEEEIIEEKESEDKIITRVCSWLQMNTKWLLLLDNVNDDLVAKDIFTLLPHIGGDIILTTRVHLPSNKAMIIHVNKMEEAEAIFLLLGITSMDSIDQKSRYTQEIIAELDYMPLAINLARAYVNNTQTSLQHYLSMLKTKRDVLFRYQNKDTADEYSHTIATVWQLSLECIQKQNPVAVQILEACAFLQSENIPMSFFENQYLLLKLLTSSSKSKQSSERSLKIIREAIAMLVEYSFVTPIWKEIEEDKEDTKCDFLTVHRLVQKVIYDTMAGEQRLHWEKNIAMALTAETSFTDSYAPRTRNVMGAYLSHIRHFLTLLDSLSQKSLKSETVHELLNQSTKYLIDNGMCLGVEELAQLSIRVSETLYGPEHSSTLSSLTQLSLLYNNQGAFNKAELVFKRVLAIEEKRLGLEHPTTVTVLNNLAITYKNQGRYTETEPLFQRVLALREKILGPEHPDIAWSLNSLAGIFELQGRYDEAEPLLQRALVIREKALGAEHLDTVSSLRSLAQLYLNQAKDDEAEPLLQRVLAIHENVLGSEHPYTASSLSTLAVLFEHRGKYDEAELLQQRALAIREKVLGSEHPDVARSLDNLAKLYIRQNKYGDAEPMLQRALVISEKMLGSAHPHTVMVLHNLAEFYKRQGNYEKADPLYQRALATHINLLNTPKPLNSPAMTYQDQDKYDEIESLAKNEKLESKNPTTAYSLATLAMHNYDHGKYDEAEPLFQQVLAKNEKMFGPEHPITIHSLGNLAKIYCDRGKYDEAEPLLKRTLAINEKMLKLKHPDTVQSLTTLAIAQPLTTLSRIYCNRGKYGEAEPLLRRVLAIKEKMLGPEHPETTRALGNLSSLLHHLYGPQYTVATL